MQLQNFECQIAKAQIGRYAAGDALSDEAVSQLEAHVAKCPECKQSLAERRAVLQALLTTGEPQPKNEEEVSKAKFDLGQFIRSKVKPREPVHAVVETGSKPAAFTKPALYSLALGAVLIGMSYAGRNMGSVLGPTAAESGSAAKQNPTPAAPQSKGSTTKPETTTKKDVAEPSDFPTPTPKPSVARPKAPVVHAKAQPNPAKKPAAKHEHKHKQSHKTPRSDSNSIRVYEPEN